MRTIDILQRLFASDDNVFLYGLFKEFLDRFPKPEEYSFFLDLMNKGKAKYEVYRYIIMSQEFKKKLLQKTPQYWYAKQKKPGDSRVHFLKSLAESGEDSVFLAKSYRECSGNELTPNEYNEYNNLIRSGKSRSYVIKTMLLSSKVKDVLRPLCDKENTGLSISDDPERLWPDVAISFTFRDGIKRILDTNQLPFSTSILVNMGGIGDSIHMTVVAKALKTKDPENPVVIIIPNHKSLFDEHPNIDLAIAVGYLDRRIIIKSLFGLTENVYDIRYISRGYGSWQKTRYFAENKWYYDHFAQSGCHVEELQKHVCGLMLYSLGLEKYADSNDICIVPDDIPTEIKGRYVVVCDSTGSVPGELKRWIWEEWEGLIRWLHGQGIIPVQLGRENDPLINPGVMDLRGQTTMRQAAGYLRNSAGYIGIEGGLFHLAKAVGAPAVVIFSTTPDVCFAYSDTGVATERKCDPCWWTDAWLQAKCCRGEKKCLNLPAWQSVAVQASDMLRTR